METYEIVTSIGEQLRKSLLDQFAYRFQKIEKMLLLAVARILDPRFKKLYCTDRMVYADAINQITREMHEMCGKTSMATPTTTSNINKI